MIKLYNKGSISYGNFKHYKNFVTSGKEQAEMFVNVIEESYKNRLVRTSVVVKFIKGENELQELLRFRKMNVEPRLSTFAKLLDVERFLKNAIAFIFFLALKSLTIWGKTVNNTTKKKLFRVSDLDTKSDTYTMANWVHRLINYTGGRNKEITGEELIESA